MSSVLIELGLAAIGLLPIVASYQLRESMAVVRRQRAAWLAMGALAQLLGGLLLLGVVHGTAVVVGGWMALGGPFVACLNAHRGRTLAAARWLCVFGSACLGAGMLARGF